ncbi:MFS transporter [Actinoplanes sp. NPDC023801]|uniref:MFS transporter n=1 Tax=Actinoplanes sp. NPDC023801 TaxID=3154595 RepID=UPI0033CA6429
MGLREETRHRAGGREWAGLAVLALPSLLVSMDLTVLNLAVPALSADLAPTADQLLWIVDVYGFLLAGLLITMGAIGDRIGRRRLLMIGAAAFAVASVAAATAGSATTLIVARALLGVAGATLMPSTLSLIRNMFTDDRQRTVAIGVWTAAFSAGGVAGPLFGGLLLTNFWWGAVFLAGVPVMALVLLAAPVLVPEHRDPHAGGFDLAGAVLSLAAVLAVIYGVKTWASGGPAGVAAAAVAAGLAAAATFLRHLRRSPRPLIDPALFRVPGLAVALVASLVAFFTAFGMMLLFAQYLQSVLGLTPLWAGVWTVPSAVGFVLGCGLGPALAGRLRPASVMAGGLLFAAAGFVLLALAGPQQGLAPAVAGSVVIFLGLAPVYILATDQVVSSSPVEQSGAASAVSETATELGSALGIALLGSVAAAVYGSRMAGADVPAGAGDTVGGAVDAAAALPAGPGAQLLASARAAFTDGMQAAAYASAALLVVIAAVTVLSLRRAGAGRRG